MSTPTLIPAIELPLTREMAEQQAAQNLRQLNSTSALSDLREDFLQALQQPIALKGRMNKVLKIADQMARVIVPHTACRTGCSYCCHTSVAVSMLEAQLIGEHIGKAPLKAPARQSRAETAHYHRQPCPFLADGECSIYAARPMACRLMFNLSDSPYFCNTEIDPENSHVSLLNLKDLELAFTGTFLEAGYADIRDLFPVGAGRKHSKGSRNKVRR